MPIRLVETYLSRKPRRDAKPLAAFLLAVMFAVSMAYWNYTAPDYPLAATGDAVYRRHEYWRLLTTLFVHSDMGHLLANSLMFVVLGYLLHGYFGYALFPLGAFVFGAITDLITLRTYPPDVHLVGVSGVIYWMSGFWLVLYFCVDRRYSTGGRLLRCLGFALATLFPSSYRPEVSYRTHAVGFALGVVCGAYYFVRHRERLRAAERYVDEIEWDPEAEDTTR